MRVVIGGASGFLGAALVTHLRAGGHDVTRLVRTPVASADESRWDPASGEVDLALVSDSDAVVNLSGAPVSRWPRTRSYRDEILTSRTSTTATLARAVAQAPTPPTFVSASGMSWYGVDRGDESLPETASAGTGFLADVTHVWEAAAQPALDAGARTAFVRTSLVLDRSGGVLKLMLPPFRLGGGARLGSGRQHMSLISLTDWVRGVAHLLETPTASGPFNLALPGDQTNAEFTDALGDALRRPTVLAVPGFAIKGALGGIADDLLGSLRIQPEALLASGFTFEHPDLASALAAALR